MGLTLLISFYHGVQIGIFALFGVLGYLLLQNLAISSINLALVYI